jgi:hypothetical protein
MSRSRSTRQQQRGRRCGDGSTSSTCTCRRQPPRRTLGRSMQLGRQHMHTRLHLPAAATRRSSARRRLPPAAASGQPASRLRKAASARRQPMALQGREAAPQLGTIVRVCLPAWHEVARRQLSSKSGPYRAHPAAFSTASSSSMEPQGEARGASSQQAGPSSSSLPAAWRGQGSKPNRRALGGSGGPAVLQAAGREPQRRQAGQLSTSTGRGMLCGPRLGCTPGGPPSCSAPLLRSTSSPSTAPKTYSASSMVGEWMG